MSYKDYIGQLKKQVAEQWKILNEYGIYTKEDLDKAIKETELDIGIFVTPLKAIKRRSKV